MKLIIINDCQAVVLSMKLWSEGNEVLFGSLVLVNVFYMVLLKGVSKGCIPVGGAVSVANHFVDVFCLQGNVSDLGVGIFILRKQ